MSKLGSIMSDFEVVDYHDTTSKVYAVPLTYTAREEIKNIMLEVVGEDEDKYKAIKIYTSYSNKDWDEGKTINKSALIRNKFRAKLRERIEEL